MRKLLIWMHSPEHAEWSIPAESVARIRAALGPEWTVRTLDIPLDATGDGPGASPDELLMEIADAEVFCGFGIAPDAFDAARRLRWVHSGAAGISASLFPALVESDVLLTSSAGVYAEPVAEHVLAMILYFARGLDESDAGKRTKSWRRDALSAGEDLIVELTDRIVGVVGYGGIGRAIGRRAAALGMRVWGLRGTLPPAGDAHDEVEQLWGADELGRLLEGAHYVVLSVPDTPATRGLVGGQELRRMRRDAVLINVARGRILDEEALADALRAGRLRGAALDVFQEEPLPPDSPLWELDNALLTPHVSGLTPRFWSRQTDLIVENLRRYLDDVVLDRLVDKQRGY